LSEYPVGELRQLLVVATRQIRSDLANVFLYDVRVVEKPVAGWTYVDTALRCIGEPFVYFVQYVPRVVETVEQRAVSTLFPWRKKAMLARDVARMSRKAIGPENFAAYRPNELSVRTVVSKTKEAKDSVPRVRRRDYCRCHVLLLPAIVHLSLRSS